VTAGYSPGSLGRFLCCHRPHCPPITQPSLFLPSPWSLSSLASPTSLERGRGSWACSLSFSLGLSLCLSASCVMWRSCAVGLSSADVGGMETAAGYLPGVLVRAPHELTCGLIWIRPAGIFHSKNQTRIRADNFPWVTCLNRSGTCMFAGTCEYSSLRVPLY